MKINKTAIFIALIVAIMFGAPTHAQGECPPRTCGAAASYHIGGYYDVKGRWVPGLISNETWFLSQPRYTTGRAVFYAPGLMRATATYNGFSLDGFIDGIALMSPADIGKTAWLRRPGHRWEGPFLVVDCAAQTDMYSVVYYNREVVEVGFQTALHWEMATLADNQYGYLSINAAMADIEVALVIERPPEKTPWNPIYYPDWWLERMSFTDHIQGQPYFYGTHWTVPGVGVVVVGIQDRFLVQGTWFAFDRSSAILARDRFMLR